MCGFMDYLGWFNMSPSEQWGIVLRFLGIFGAIGLAWWTAYSWVLAKKIELEMILLENTASGRAYFYNLDESGSVKDTSRSGFQEYLDMYTKTTERIIDNNLSLAELRDLNKLHIAGTRFIQKYTEIRTQKS